MSDAKQEKTGLDLLSPEMKEDLTQSVNRIDRFITLEALSFVQKHFQPGLAAVLGAAEILANTIVRAASILYTMHGSEAEDAIQYALQCARKSGAAERLRYDEVVLGRRGVNAPSSGTVN
jgi:hypothetical protein